MSKWTHRLLAILLAMVMLCSVTALSATAAIQTGKCGPDANYTFDTATGVLNITGTGEIANRWSRYYDDVSQEWKDYIFWEAWLVKTAVVGEGITKLNGAFGGCYNLTSISLPNSLEEISSGAFSQCLNLSTVTIPPNVTTIGSHAFSDCTSLTAITIPKSVTSIGVIPNDWNWLWGGDIPITVASPFDHGAPGMQITIEAGNPAYKMAGNALMTMDGKTLVNFSGSGTAQSYSVPSGVETIAARAFTCESRVNALHLPSSVKLAADVFCGMPSITVDAGNSWFSALDGNLYNKDKTTLYYSTPTLVDFVMPNSVTKAYGDLYSRNSITISDSLDVEDIYWISTKQILVNATSPRYTSVSGVLFSKDLKRLVRLPSDWERKSYTIPDDTDTVARNAVKLHPGQKIIIPKSVTKLEDEAINYADSITLGREITDIGDWNLRNSWSHYYLNDNGMWFMESSYSLVYCYKDSVVHTYCEDNRIDYILIDGSITKKNGDVEIIYNNGAYDGDIEFRVTEDDAPAYAFTLIDDKLNPVEFTIYKIETWLNGEKVDPNDDCYVWIKIKLPDGFDNNAQVFYMNPENWTMTNMQARIEDGYIMFKTNHFSLYALVQPSTTPGGNDPVTANKTALNARISALNGLQKGKFTDASWNTFQAALSNARAISGNASATQAQVDAALNALNSAHSNLAERILYTQWPKTIWNWIMFFGLFGFIWMSFIKP